MDHNNFEKWSPEWLHIDSREHEAGTPASRCRRGRRFTSGEAWANPDGTWGILVYEESPAEEYREER